MKTMEITKFKVDREVKCDNCGKAVVAGEFMFPVQFAVGSTGFVGQCCVDEFDEEATVSEDGLAEAHWKK